VLALVEQEIRVSFGEGVLSNPMESYPMHYDA
jgi:hypothetical protein